jgi:hypothetical protein
MTVTGSSSCSSSRRFGPTSTFRFAKPVRLPPGVEVGDKAHPGGVNPSSKMVRAVVGAALAATAAGVPPPSTMTST